MLYLDPKLVVQISPSSVRVLDVAPYNQFTVSCTARAEVNEEVVPYNLIILWIRRENNTGVVTFKDVDPMQYETSVLPDHGYKSILTTTENDAQNIIGYRCRAKLTDRGSKKNKTIQATCTITMEVQGMFQVYVIDLVVCVLLESKMNAWSLKYVYDESLMHMNLTNIINNNLFRTTTSFDT